MAKIIITKSIENGQKELINTIQIMESVTDVDNEKLTVDIKPVVSVGTNKENIKGLNINQKWMYQGTRE